MCKLDSYIYNCHCYIDNVVKHFPKYVQQENYAIST